jgi:endoglucanase
MTDQAQTVLPRWRGFNLLGLFTVNSDGHYREQDFRWTADWGFDFIRLPMSYRWWTDPEEDPFAIDESVLETVDQAVEWGQQYGLHTSLNLHRAPGYCVNRGETEPFDLWKDQAALDAFCYHWQTFARRYQGISSEQVSFDLVNEPPPPSPEVMTRDDHARVVRAAVDAIREIDPERRIIIDGLAHGRLPCPELADQGIAQSCRAYDPMGVSHYKASWAGGDGWPEPVWPGALHEGMPWSRHDLEERYQPWAELARQGVGVHCGECGAYNRTPHKVFLAWFEDVLEILEQLNIGWGLWNLSGAFGVLDSGRQDVDYQEWHGHKLDAELLALLQAH